MFISLAFYPCLFLTLFYIPIVCDEMGVPAPSKEDAETFFSEKGGLWSYIIEQHGVESMVGNHFCHARKALLQSTSIKQKSVIHGFGCVMKSTSE